MTEQWSPRAAVWPLAIAIAVKCSKQSLERSEAAIALLAGEVAIALVTRVAAIGRIADPFVDVNLVAATAARPATADERKEPMTEQPAVAASAVAVARIGRAPISARCTAVRATFVVAAGPDNRLGQANAG